MGAPEIPVVDRRTFIGGEEVDLREAPGYEGFYAASRDGRIYSLRYSRWLSPATTRGYLVVTLSRRGRQKVCKVHRIVAAAWVPNPLGHPQVNHLNGVKSDNRAANLEWANASRQQFHARALGLVKTTPAMRAASARNISRVGRTFRKLTDEQADSIRQMISRGANQRALARQYGVTPSAIQALWKGRTYVD
jgi:hypothetical protein